ncbi:hypothetical protein MUK42_03219, partial [Musa troglodytarum]
NQLCLCLRDTKYILEKIQRRDVLQLGYFNGPWIARIFLVTVAIWWSLSEIARLHLFKRTALLQHCMAENVQLKSQKQAAYISGYHATRMMIVSGHADAIVNVRHANLMDVVALQHNAY